MRNGGNGGTTLFVPFASGKLCLKKKGEKHGKNFA